MKQIVGIMNKTRHRNIIGMVVYMCIAMLFGRLRSAVRGNGRHGLVGRAICTRRGFAV